MAAMIAVIGLTSGKRDSTNGRPGKESTTGRFVRTFCEASDVKT